jgi:hypothetical protein
MGSRGARRRRAARRGAWLLAWLLTWLGWALLAACPLPAAADVVRDGTIGPGAGVQPGGPDFQIDETLGEIRGSNLSTASSSSTSLPARARRSRVPPASRTSSGA